MRRWQSMYILKDACLIDPIAGDSAFTGTRVKLVEIAQALAWGR